MVNKLLGIMVVLALLAPAVMADGGASVDISATIASYAAFTPTTATISVVASPTATGTEVFTEQVVGTLTSNGPFLVDTSTGDDMSLDGLGVTTLTTEIRTVVDPFFSIGGETTATSEWYPSGISFPAVPYATAPGVTYTISVGVRLLNRNGLADPPGAYSGKTLTLTIVP